ncbi:uncharacterized protein LOC143628360 [Bidens hawaiensis]|uniref:uncharacterized protein LOC143628360 n=1 Tax=Bidens hawaiensis TaxID=980011 RepID=UPI00404AAF0D
MDLIISQNVELKKLPKALGNNKYLCPSTQKDVAHCFKEEVLKRIFDEIGDDVFVLLVDESSDVSGKEQMAIVLRYVDTYGIIKEIFKSSIDTFFAKHNLSSSRLRGQGYDEASNMRSEFNELKAKFLEESKSSYYVYYYVVVVVVKKHLGVGRFFDKLATLLNVVCASCKRNDILRETKRERVAKEINCGLIMTGSGLNQELSPIRPGDTR